MTLSHDALRELAEGWVHTRHEGSWPHVECRDLARGVLAALDRIEALEKENAELRGEVGR